MKRNNIIIFCTDFHYLKIFFTEQTKLLALHGNVTVICSASKKDFNKEFLEYKNIQHFNVKVGRKISLINDFVTALRVIYLFLLKRPVMIQSIFPKSGFSIPPCFENTMYIVFLVKLQSDKNQENRGNYYG